MAARAGAVIADAEFVQFHPDRHRRRRSIRRRWRPKRCAAKARSWSTPKASASCCASIRAASCSPRDIVARGVFAEIAAGRGAFLDCRTAIGEHFAEAFPTVYAHLPGAPASTPRREPIPVAPAAHYHMGGIATDQRGRTSVAGLWAVGEVASTGLHGANRLASNSLLEAVVFGARAAADIAASIATRARAPTVELKRIT